MGKPLIDPQILRWLNSVHEGMNATLRQEAPNLYLNRGETVDTEHLDSAICSHLAWREKLEAFFVDASGTRLEPALVGRDDLCGLGRWLHGEGTASLGKQADFVKLMQAHADFHCLVGNIVDEARLAGASAARARLNQAEYLEVSWRVVEAISQLVQTLDKPA